jgi:hypothetical protein
MSFPGLFSLQSVYMTPDDCRPYEIGRAATMLRRQHGHKKHYRIRAHCEIRIEAPKVLERQP